MLFIGELNIQTNDFINELEEKQKKLSKFDKANEILEMKDEIIWNMMQEKKEIEQRELSLVKDRARTEIIEWKQ